jgi:hypothetical protein
MERGQLGFEEQLSTVFVFEGLIAQPPSRKFRYKRLETWSLNVQVLDYMADLINRHGVPVDVVTWQPPSFAEAVHDSLWDMGVFVRETKSGTYGYLSQHIATDTMVSLVYDPDPHHRFGYGYKAREFSIGRL